MKLRYLVAGGFILALTGCTDTPESIAREYRNSINEFIDAMMMVNDERTALRMRDRILKPMSLRFKAIDDRLDKMVPNKGAKKEFALEALKSDGVHMYLAEVEINKQRFSLEITRLRTVYDQLVEDAVKAGKEKPEEDLPALLELVRPGGLTEAVRTQLNDPKIYTLMMDWSELKIKGYEGPNGLLSQFIKRRERFDPKEKIQLTK